MLYPNIVKPRVYIETSIVSYLTSRTSNDLRMMANRDVTIEWWDLRRTGFCLFVSEFVVAEASRGDPGAASRRMSVIEGIEEIEAGEAVKELARLLMAEGALPANSEMDALHVAVATVNGMDYLLTWNCKHIANAVLRPVIERVCRQYGFEPPVICTPLELIEE